MYSKVIFFCCFCLYSSVDTSTEQSACAPDGGIRLVGGRYKNEGRLEICRDGMWETVCNEDWDITDANVACAELSQDPEANIELTAAVVFFNPGNASQPIHASKFNCSGDEVKLVDCMTGRASTTCNHTRDVGLICAQNVTDVVAVCNDGEVRLVGGPTMDEGRVEYCVGGLWGTVCNENWDTADAAVVCNQLGLIPFEDDKQAVDRTVPSSGAADNPIVLSGLECKGNESSLTECTRATTISQCTHNRDAGVRCMCPNDNEVRLADGEMANEGRVEYCQEGIWKVLCSKIFNQDDANVLCRQLGLISTNGTLPEIIENDNLINFGYLERGDTSYLRYRHSINCVGSEQMLSDCPMEDLFVCFIHGVGVRCPVSVMEVECENNDIRVQNGSISPQVGRVEVCFNNRWGLVCNSKWDNHDATVACKQLGFKGGIAVTSQWFGSSDIDAFLNNLECKGTELNLFACKHPGITQVGNCYKTENIASLICGTPVDPSIERRCDMEVNSTANVSQSGEVFNIGNYGACEPFQSPSRICGGILNSTDYVFNANSVLSQAAIVALLDKTFPNVLTELDGPLCKEIVSKILCNYFFPSCGNVDGVHLPISICSRECFYVRETCPQTWSVIEQLLSNGKLGAIKCDNLTFQFQGLSPCCSGLDINVTEPLTTTYTTLSAEITLASDNKIVGLIAPLAGGILASIFGIVIVLVIIVICLHYINTKRKHIVRDIQLDIASNPSSPEIGPMEKGVLHSRLRQDSQSTKMVVPNAYSKFFGAQNEIDFSAPLLSPVNNSQNRINSCFIKDISGNMIIPNSRLRLLELIGQVPSFNHYFNNKWKIGEFGVVYKADYTQPSEVDGYEDSVYTVAVKTLKGSFNIDNANQIMNESLKMKCFDHPNVLSLIGVCLDAGPAPYVVIPFMANGSLLHYLKRERKNVVLTSDIDDDVRVDLEKRLMIMCFQISSGMEYLAAEKFIHRDLAARNCMIDIHFVIKIADFGLSENVYIKNYFRQGESDNCIKLPIKWMAPESLNDGVFSEKTDVWSFGVTCWEIFSGGRTPYPGIDPLTLVHMLDAHQMLGKPLNAACSNELYSLMMSCWSPDPEQRPTFSEIVKVLSCYTETLAGYLDMTSNPFVSSLNSALQRDCRLQSLVNSRPNNKLTALYYNVASKLRGRSTSPKLKSPKSSPRISPHPDLVCSANSDIPASPVIKITIDSPDH